MRHLIALCGTDTLMADGHTTYAFVWTLFHSLVLAVVGSLLVRVCERRCAPRNAPLTSALLQVVFVAPSAVGGGA